MSFFLVQTSISGGAELATWDFVLQSDIAAVSSSGLGVVPTNVTTGPGISNTNDSDSGAWRTRGYSGDVGYIEFAITAEESRQITVESLIVGAYARAANTSGGGEWTDPEVVLEYDTDPAFSNPVNAGVLDMGPSLAEGSNAVSADYLSDSSTFFATDLVINPEETYYFRLRAIGATGTNLGRNQLYYLADTDLTLNGSVDTIVEGLLWAGDDGDAWNTTEANFVNGGLASLFTTGADVLFDSEGAVEVDAGGITAGMLSVTTDSGVTTFQGGDLASIGLFKTGDGDALLGSAGGLSPIVFDTGTGETVLEGGLVRVTEGSSYTTAGFTLSGDSEFRIDGGITTLFTNTGPTVVESGGGTFRVNTGAFATLGEISATSPDYNFRKNGSGTLTLNGPVGVAGVAPVGFDFNGGTTILEGPIEIAVAGGDDDEVTVSGEVLFQGANLRLHGVTVDGNDSGLLSVADFPATITSQLAAGTSDILIPISLAEELTFNVPDGGNLLRVDAEISGTGSIRKSEFGELVFEVPNSYTGGTTVEGGILTLDGSFSKPASVGTGPINLGTGATLNVLQGGEVDLTQEISGGGLLVLEGDFVRFGGVDSKITLGDSNSYSGGTEILDGTVEISSLANYDEPCSLGNPGFDPAKLLLKGGAVLSYVGPEVVTDREFTLGGGGATLSSDGTGPMTFSVDSDYPIEEDGTGSATRVLTLTGTSPGLNGLGLQVQNGINADHAITKAGPTSWALTGDNIYNGETTIEEGILRIDGDNSGALGNIVVQSGGYLGGVGESGAAAIIESEGGLAVSISDWNGTADVGFDQLAVDSLDASSGTVKVLVDASELTNFTESDQSFTILTTTNGISNFSSANVVVETTGFTGFGPWELEAVGTSLVLSYTAGSDPYPAWTSSFGLSGSDAEPGTDFDGDGLTNLQEYAYGLDPTSGASISPIQEALSAGAGTFSYTRRLPSVTGLTYSYLSSTTLVGEFDPFTAVSESSDGGDPVEVITVTVPDALLENSKLFVQVSAE